MSGSTPLQTISQIRAAVGEGGSLHATLHAQAESVLRKDSSNGKPFFEIKLRDDRDSLILRAWSDSPPFTFAQSLTPGSALALTGDFFLHPNFGLEARSWTLDYLDESSAAALYEGTPEVRAALETDFATIQNLADSITDPRLRRLSQLLLTHHGTRFRRAAAARTFHHARRGGLCAHTTQMLRSADALCHAYPRLNRDLLLTGILFHDAGKLWETCPPERGFDLPFQLHGEMLGHIIIGLELINKLWMELAPEREEWKALLPENETVRLHLLHLVASHHGELEFGSPVQPKTPEALALHLIDNLDAKLEMMWAGYQSAAKVAPEITERVRPLNVSLIYPLPSFDTPPTPPTSS